MIDFGICKASCLSRSAFYGVNVGQSVQDEFQCGKNIPAMTLVTAYSPATAQMPDVGEALHVRHH